MPIEILMPALSPTMTEGNLAKWVKNEGDSVAPGDVIAEIETDKATMEVEAVEEGTIGKIIVSEGSQSVQVNQVIALLLEEGEDTSAVESYEIKQPEVAEDITEDAPANNNDTETASPAAPKSSANQAASFAPPPPAPSFNVGTSAKPATSKGGERVKASPLAKRMAADSGIDLSGVMGTGPKGRIIKADVEDAQRTGGGKRLMRHSEEVYAVPNNNMRKVIATRLLQSKQYVPHFYLNVDCELDALLSVRKDINDAASVDENGKPAYKVSVNDLIIKAVGLGLKEVPEANASWTDEAIMMYNNVDVSVAVAIDGGLVTPIVKNADQKDLPTISTEMKGLARRARDGKLSPEEYQGGGFSISNLGMYGIKQFNAIINPPQSCILAIGSGEQRPVVKNGALVPATVMSVTLSCDHRVVDGAVGAEFLGAFKRYIEKPVTMLL